MTAKPILEITHRQHKPLLSVTIPYNFPTVDFLMLTSAVVIQYLDFLSGFPTTIHIL